MADEDKRRIGELEDEIKRKNERIEELRQEIDEQRDLIGRLREHVEDYASVIENWKEAFGMTMTDDGNWTWEPFWKERNDLIENFNKLVRDWNKYLPLINGRTQPVGRPLAASDAQAAQVLKLHKAGRSLRGIADDTNLTFATVRTIVGKANGTDRTTQKHRARIEIDRYRLARWTRQRRTGDALPKRAQRMIEQGEKLIKEAKGLGRA
jgi:hypothetical protein